MISHTTLRFAISSWKYIPSIAALHLTMPPVLGEHPFTEWIHHRSDKAVVSYSSVSPYFTKALTITEVSCLVVALSAKGKELRQDSGNTANELFKRDKKNIQECNEFCVLWHEHLFLLIQGTMGITELHPHPPCSHRDAKTRAFLLPALHL